MALGTLVTGTAVVMATTGGELTGVTLDGAALGAELLTGLGCAELGWTTGALEATGDAGTCDSGLVVTSGAGLATVTLLQSNSSRAATIVKTSAVSLRMIVSSCCMTGWLADMAVRFKVKEWR